MILAEKITKLRKQNGWSQEDLAMRGNSVCSSLCSGSYDSKKIMYENM